MPMVAATATSMQPAAATPGPAGASAAGGAAPVLKMQEDHICCNPFRIPRHFTRSNLRVVPDLIRERLPRVSFTGPKICDSCRNRVHLMLKERRFLKPSPRFSEPDRRKSDTHRRSSLDTAASTPLKIALQPNPAPITTKMGVEEEKKVPLLPDAPTVETAQLTVSVEVVEKEKEEELGGQPGTSTSLNSQGCGIVEEPPNLTGDLNTPFQSYSMALRRNSKTQQQPQQQHQLNMDQRQFVRTCCFCGLSEENDLEFGKFYEDSGIHTHYYCLLLSSQMVQKGNDDEGILGFLADDIQKEIRRGKRLVCFHCKKNGATLGCCNAKCKRMFHYPCGLKAGSLHQFFGEFRSYCINHKPRQKIDLKIQQEVKSMTEILCCICYEDVVPLDNEKTLWAPCCKKNAWFHRKCVQQLAMSTGYFFKCPLCNNKKEFQLAMLEHGIFIPRRDASWELVPNAFEELLYRHDHCDAKVCICPKGRKYSSNGKWELILCRMCGSQGVHILCGKLKFSNPRWDCEECLSIIKKPSENSATDESTSDTNDTTNSIRENERIVITRRISGEDSDSDISVGDESMLTNSFIDSQESMSDIRLRPGPKSFKHRQMALKRSSSDSQERIDSSSSSSISNKPNNIIENSKNATTSKEVICIDSDDEAIEILCESTMRNRSKPISRFNFGNRTANSTMITSQIQSRGLIKESPKKWDDGVTSNQLTESNFDNSNTVIEQIPGDATFNIVITNVTSLSAESFENEPEPEEESSPMVVEEHLSKLPLLPPPPLTSISMKRNYPDEDIDCQILSEGPKRARLDDGRQINYSESSLLNPPQPDFNAVKTIDNLKHQTFTSNVMDNSFGPTSSLGASGAPALDSLSGGADRSDEVVGQPVNVGNGGSGPDDSAATTTTTTIGQDSATAASTVDNLTGTIPPPSNAATATISPDNGGNSNFESVHSSDSSARTSDKLPFRSLECNSSSNNGCINGLSGNSRSKSNSSDYRTGLNLPEIVRLSDIKFKICGSKLELSYGARKFQVKMKNGLQKPTKLSNGSKTAESASMFSFAGSNKNLSSESNTKSTKPRSEDINESETTKKSGRTQSLGSFVYEDDNTLLEYPTSPSSLGLTKNFRSSKKSLFLDKCGSKSDRTTDLKENWNPELSSNNNTHDNSYNSQTNSFDTVENNLSTRDKLTDSNLVQSPKDAADMNQRLLRRSSRHIRHFRSVQETNFVPNGQFNGTLTNPNESDSISQLFLKSPHQTVIDQSFKDSKVVKVNNNSFCITEENKHFKNVDINDTKLTLACKVDDEIGTIEEDFKVKKDVQKNIKLKPVDLFFNNENISVNSLHACKIEEKLKIEFKFGERKFLVKSRSFDCLADFNVKEDSHLLFGKSLSKSLYDLSKINNPKGLISLTDKVEDMEKKVRRSERRKTK